MPASHATQPQTVVKDQAAELERGLRKPFFANRSLKTAAIWALVLFGAINAALWTTVSERKASSGETMRDLWSGTASIDLAVNGFNQLHGRPDVVLVGSSLIMYPFWAMDKAKNPRIPDIFHHHDSLMLKEALAGKLHKPVSVYSLAIFGQMASDAYIYMNEYLKGDKTPSYVVLGIAPRDFHDANLASPMSTLTFQRLVGLENFSKYANAYLPRWEEKAEFVASHMCFFYGKRLRLQHEVDKAVTKVLDAVTKGQANAGERSDANASKTGGGSGFMMGGTPEERWQNSLDEYRGRYRNIADKDLSVQMGFLKKSLDVCGERGIRVILVNMPLTQANRELFPPDFYRRFREQIGKIASRPGVKMIDLGESEDFVRQDYWDTTHLNHAGGYKLLKHIVPAFD